MQEHELIHQFFTNKMSHPNVELGVGDDAAIIHIPNGQSLVTSIDTMVSGVSFPTETSPEDIGYKALAVSISDTAAMGAKPETALLSLTLPEANEDWLTAFSRGFYACLDAFQMVLVGGDITKGPLTVTTTVNSLVPTGKAIMRSDAKVGDRIYVTGPLGDAGYALQLLQQNKTAGVFLNKLNRPTPRVDEGIKLRSIATSAIDISDGLATDLEKLCDASQVGAKVNLEDLPISDDLKSAADHDTAIRLALTAGDDFELCFTTPPNYVCSYPCIGRITQEKGLKLKDKHGTLMTLSNKGYEHF